jgi:antitoxin component of RelBE/YafQ-DinJ toxin-antitoxin module
MNNTVIQIPVSKQLRQQSETAATQAGFSSVQEVIRVFLNQFSQQKIIFNFDTPAIKLSIENEKKYLKIISDLQKNKNIISTNSTDDFFAKIKK